MIYVLRYQFPAIIKRVDSFPDMPRNINVLLISMLLKTFISATIHSFLSLSFFSLSPIFPSLPLSLSLSPLISLSLLLFLFPFMFTYLFILAFLYHLTLYLQFYNYLKDINTKHPNPTTHIFIAPC